MSKRRFFLKLTAFFLPIVAIFALPLAALVKSYEIMPTSVIAATHAKATAHAVYGAAYSNPDKGYKVAGLRLRQPPSTAIGTSRVMQFRSDFFHGGEAAFYNGGGTITRLWDYRPLFKRLHETKTRRVILGIDQWAFNSAWSNYAPDPGVGAEYDGDYSTLDTIQHSLKIYPDIRAGKVSLSQLFGPSDSLGVNGITHRNGFERDGSYLYSDLLSEQQTKPGFHDEDVFERIRTGTRRCEPGDHVAKGALLELRLLLEQLERDGFEVVAFEPPFPPSVLEAMRATRRMGYVFEIPGAIRPIFEEHRIPFVDLTSCEVLGCRDEDFLDGFHAGPFMYAKIALELAKRSPWLAEMLDNASLERRLAAPHQFWNLPYE